MLTDPVNQFYDAYSQYATVIDNIYVDGRNNLAMGFLLSGQQTCKVGTVVAMQCTIGIVLTRAWNYNIDSLKAFHCDLGVSTIPATTLTAEHLPTPLSGVDDTAVNNMNVGEITVQDCGSGIYLNVVLQSNFNVIDVERYTDQDGYGMRCVSTNCFFPNVHIENTGAGPDVVVKSVYANRYPSFGCLQAAVIDSDRPIFIDTLLPYTYYDATKRNYVEFTDNLVANRPVVNRYCSTLTKFAQNQIIGLGAPLGMMRSDYQSNGVDVTPINYMFILVNNKNSSAVTPSGTLKIPSFGGLPSNEIDLSTLGELPSNGFAGLVVQATYALQGPALLHVTGTGIQSNIYFTFFNYYFA